eukprot:TRINITY_DN53946_c1_g1_i1.p1 TRINITY_DN53946_c1_g1~~TRINITY_DN53946_c1_g1_i1.p1  ORF type:complete len:248 (-),score=17.49 TRINITY_DN53946_c1_g1_i1:468-1211(-)
MEADFLPGRQYNSSNVHALFVTLVGQFHQVLWVKQRGLDNSMAQWATNREYVNDINDRLQGDDEILFLDVGGTAIHTSQRTLQSDRAAGSMLGVWLSGDWSSFWQIEKEDDDTILIDRDGEAFRFVLDWLRDGASHELFSGNVLPSGLLCDASQVDKFRDWVTTLQVEGYYYGLSSLVEHCNNRFHLLQKRLEQVFDFTSDPTLFGDNPTFTLPGTTPSYTRLRLAGLQHPVRVRKVVGLPDSFQPT